MKSPRGKRHHVEHDAEEIGVVRKSWGGRIPIALIYPNRYATGMSNLGFQFVYYLLNQEPDIVCERAFLPEPDDLDRPDEVPPPRSMESGQPLGRFEILAFSVSYENDYPHLLRILSLSGVPLEAGHRHPPHPLVWVGGIIAAMNPEPLASFVDLFAVGEAEELLPDLLRTYRECRLSRLTKSACLESLNRVDGAYVPSLYQVRYDNLGRVRSFKPRVSTKAGVRRRYARDLSDEIPSTRILTSATAFESLFLVEIGRGCSRGCRFCAAGHVLSPTRQRKLNSLLEAIGEGIRSGKRIGLVSSSVCDHPRLDELCRAVLSAGGQISVASVRLDAMSEQLLRSLADSGHRTLSLAPEAGSQRLRDVIKKGISEEQIFEAARRIARVGIPRLRLYFMVGLPTERWEDVDAIVALTRRVLHHARGETDGRGFQRITLSINPFVPKPFTPFQWHPFLEVEELKARIHHVRRSVRKDKNILVIYEPPKWARIQALLSRGDRRLGRVLLLVTRGLSWDEALNEININPAFYLHRKRDLKERFPWDFIAQGYSKSSLWESYQTALVLSGDSDG